MGSKMTRELIESVRSVLGGEFSEINFIRALHLAKKDVTIAINILFDIPSTIGDESSPLQMTPPHSPSSFSPSSSSKRINDSECVVNNEMVKQDGGLAELLLQHPNQ
ncbi:unnamed protein product [Victoria cruziana]